MSAEPMKFTYFPLFAKGPAAAVALEMSGLEWEGAFPDNWKAIKEDMPWRTLPTLEVPGIGLIGHELAILNYIGQEVPKMAGESKKDFMTSQQLLAEGEDLFKALGAKQDTTFAKDKVSDEVYETFWGQPDHSTPKKEFSISMCLKLIEDFYTKVGKEGRFTDTGRTVGECKMWTMLHILKMVNEDVLRMFVGLTEFYQRFLAEKETQAVVLHGGKMPGPFPQVFVPKVLAADKGTATCA